MGVYTGGYKGLQSLTAVSYTGGHLGTAFGPACGAGYEKAVACIRVGRKAGTGVVCPWGRPEGTVGKSSQMRVMGGGLGTGRRFGEMPCRQADGVAGACGWHVDSM